MFYSIKYTKALQDILNTDGGKAARGIIGFSTPALAGRIEIFSQRKGKWSASGLSPQDAAVTSITLFGEELERSGSTPKERLAGATLQLALVDYPKQNPSASAVCAACLAKWVKRDNPPSQLGSGRFYLLLIRGDATAARVTGPIVGLSDLDRTGWIIDDDGCGALIVTADDPGKLKARYSQLGFEIATVNTPMYQLRRNETPAIVAMDLKLSGEYEELKRCVFESLV